MHLITLRSFPCRLVVLLIVASNAVCGFARDTTNLNREWKFQLGDPAGAQAEGFDAAAWSDINLPHTFSLPYFMATGFYSGYGWYRKTLNLPADSAEKCVFIEFEGAFRDAEIYVNGALVGRHQSGYTGFSLDVTRVVRVGENHVAVRLNNLWRPDLAPRAGDHTFSGGIYRDVRLVVTDPLHVVWYGTFVTTPTLAAKAGASSTVNIRTEVRNASSADRTAAVRTDIFDPAGSKVASVISTLRIAAGATVVFDQTTPAIVGPRLWHPDSPDLYRARTSVIAKGAFLARDKLADTFETTFGFRWFEWTADRGFFLNGKPTWLRGANVHQDQAGWGDAVTNAALFRDVQMVKDAGFNFIRGSHYPKDPAFGEACDRLGVLWLSENNFWGIGGRHSDGGWSASAYPVTPEDEAGFAQSVLDSLRAMIRIHRNHPSIVTWSVCNEAFFSDCPMEKVHKLLEASVALSHELDPSRPAAIGGAQRPLNSTRLDKIGDLAAYNGDGATQPVFQNPGVPNLVSEYGSVITDRPGAYDPGWGDLKAKLTDGMPTRYPWRSGEAVWCMFDHGSFAGLNLARMGIVDYFRIPKRAYFWYRNVHVGVPPPEWPVAGTVAKLGLSADKTTLSSVDGTDDTQILVAILSASGTPLSNTASVTLTIESGPGEFPTGRVITFTPSGNGDASDIAIRDGQAAIAFRSYQAGVSVIRATSPGLRDAVLTITSSGSPAYVEGVTQLVPNRPYARFKPKVVASASAIGSDPRVGAAKPSSSASDVSQVLAYNRPTTTSGSAVGTASSLANDGDPTTVWRAVPGQHEAWWQVFLEVAYDVNRVTLVFPQVGNYRYRIEVSVDGLTWKTVVDQSDTSSTEQVRTSLGDFGRGIAYVRVAFTGAPVGHMPALAEVSVGGAPALVAAPAGRLGGTIIGTSGSYGNIAASTRGAALDESTETYFDASVVTGAWVGLDLGAGGAVRITEVRYVSRPEDDRSRFAERMIGGKFQGANSADFHDAVDIFTIGEAPVPSTWTKQTVSVARLFRYVRYLSPRGGSCNVAELEFYCAIALSGPLVGTVIGTSGSYGNNLAVTREAAFDSNPATFFDAPVVTGSWVGLDLGASGAARISAIRFAPRPDDSRSHFDERMVGGKFQGANLPDFSDAVDLLTITSTPARGVFTKVEIPPVGLFRYVRYLSPRDGSCNVAEIEFFAQPVAP